MEKSSPSSSPKQQKLKSRHDAVTGALNEVPQAPEHSASDWKRFLKGPQFYDHPLSYLPGIYLFIGSLGCGKSTCVHGILSELDAIMAPKNRGKVLYYSGSGSDKMLDAFDDKIVQKFDKRSKQSFLTAVSEINNEAANTPHDKKKHNIVVVDDGILDPDLLPASVKSDTPLMQLMMSCRHTPASVFLTSQKHSAIPSFCRANANHVFVFKTKSPAENDSIMRDVGFAKEEFRKSMNSLTDPGDFLWVQNRNAKIIKGFTQGLVR